MHIYIHTHMHTHLHAHKHIFMFPYICSISHILPQIWLIIQVDIFSMSVKTTLKQVITCIYDHKKSFARSDANINISQIQTRKKNVSCSPILILDVFFYDIINLYVQVLKSNSHVFVEIEEWEKEKKKRQELSSIHT